MTPLVRGALAMLALVSVNCASVRYTARVLHPDSREPIPGVTLELIEATGKHALNGWPTMERTDRGTQITDEFGECTFRVKRPGYCSVYPIPISDFEYSDQPSDYFDKDTGVHVFFLRPRTP